MSVSNTVSPEVPHALASARPLGNIDHADELWLKDTKRQPLTAITHLKCWGCGRAQRVSREVLRSIPSDVEQHRSVFDGASIRVAGSLGGVLARARFAIDSC